MRILLMILGAIVALVLVVVVVGWMLPVGHRASRVVEVSGAPHDVFALVDQVAEYPRWRRGVTQVEVLPTNGVAQPLRFREHGSNGTILYEVAEREADRRIVTRIADSTLPFGGRWTYEISPTKNGASLRITEDGEVYNPVFRFMSRFVFGHTSTIDQYLRDVSAKLGGGGHITD